MIPFKKGDRGAGIITANRTVLFGSNEKIAETEEGGSIYEMNSP
jgi:hypothetical protein